MKKFWSLLAIVIVLSPLGLASADSISVSQVIHIRGIVPPMRNIIVDGNGNITEITSNTPENVRPKVYLRSFAGPELPLTSALTRDFNGKTRGVDMHSTDLHFALPDPAVAKARTPGLLGVSSFISFLRYVR
ncbi:MAG TPA: hypothetical protein VFI84_04630 [Candidatus Saccharimonadales bacterium]|nr:hypothetical protein [Candidatus Saccharimonadales bacterium]